MTDLSHSRPNAYDGAVSLRRLVKRFGERAVVDDVSLDVRAGEFFSLLGPSGCGKTTTLRMIAGFEQPDSGSVVIDDVDVTEFAPEKRLCNTVFQQYALFPHLDVYQNVAFGLRFSPFARDERVAVGKALELVRLTGFDKRRVQQLSGGEQQRVALARAIVLEPSVLLLDEPLGALDAQLRHALQVELSSLQRELDTTFIYVTHDQEEAFTMSDRIGMMRDGRLLQVGSPEELYEEPASVDVATFVGTANLMAGRLVNATTVEVFGARYPVAAGVNWDASRIRGAVQPNEECTVMVRPERVHLEVVNNDAPRTAGEAPIATVERVTFSGSSLLVAVRCAGIAVSAEVPNDDSVPDLSPGDRVHMVIRPDHLRVFTRQPA
ncbi:MAG: ABC transporter ATP-binding protein [Actinomycetota bacterium]